jgi:hypothetical protein
MANNKMAENSRVLFIGRIIKFGKNRKPKLQVKSEGILKQGEYWPGGNLPLYLKGIAEF